MQFNFNINTPTGHRVISLEPGTSAIFVGANGSGKTRLAVHIENSLGEQAHRISAHRALALNPEVPKISEAKALLGLKFGRPHDGYSVANRDSARWHANGATSLLNDFDFLLQAMFAEQSNRALISHQNARAGAAGKPDPTNFERLMGIWERLLPHRKLHITGDNIQVSIPAGAKYNASEMSDGERAIFYMIGQTLTASPGSVFIVDEPELHVHRSIMSKLWDELESARQDCAFVFITHDLEFAAARVARKFVIQDYDPKPQWTIDEVPETGFGEELTTLILGSRRPVLFVESTDGKLDHTIYRACFRDWTVVCRGSCEEVIHSVATMRRNKEFTRITCAGFVDADFREPEQIKHLEGLGVYVLPVAEIENLFLLPEVSRVIFELEGYTGAELDQCLADLKAEVFKRLDGQSMQALVVRHCVRRIDGALKKVGLSGASSPKDISDQYAKLTREVDVEKMAATAEASIKAAIDGGDLVGLLSRYDDKGLLALASRHLKGTKNSDFKSWLSRMLHNDKAPELVAALKIKLPVPIAG